MDKRIYPEEVYRRTVFKGVHHSSTTTLHQLINLIPTSPQPFSEELTIYPDDDLQSLELDRLIYLLSNMNLIAGYNRDQQEKIAVCLEQYREYKNSDGALASEAKRLYDRYLDEQGAFSNIRPVFFPDLRKGTPRTLPAYVDQVNTNNEKAAGRDVVNREAIMISNVEDPYLKSALDAIRVETPVYDFSSDYPTGEPPEDLVKFEKDTELAKVYIRSFFREDSVERS